MTADQLAALLLFFGPSVIDSLKASLPLRNWSSELTRSLRSDTTLGLTRLGARRLRRALDDRGWSALIAAARGDRSQLEQIASLAGIEPSQALDFTASIEANAARALQEVDYRSLLDMRLRLLQESADRTVSEGARALSQQIGNAEYSRMVASSARLRRWRLRLSVGLSERQVAASFGTVTPTLEKLERLRPGKIVFVTGPLGSGKSDTVLDWISRSADMAIHSASSPLPVIFRADEIVGPLQDAVLDHVSARDLQRLGIDLVIDGLDEAGVRSLTLAEGAVEFVARWPKSRIVIASRTSAVPRGAGHAEIDLWKPEDAEALIELASEGARTSSWSWSEELKESVRRPLFALLAAQTPEGIGPYEMIDALVRKAIKSADNNSHRDLAIAIVRADGPINPHEVASISTNSFTNDQLVNTSDRLWRFELPIFLQWFAAQGVLNGIVPVSELTESLEAFARWRYVLAVALSGASSTKFDELLQEIAAWNLGAASWVLKEIRTSALAPSRPVVASEDAIASRLSVALDALQLSPASLINRRFRPGNVTIATYSSDNETSVQWRLRRSGEESTGAFLSRTETIAGRGWARVRSSYRPLPPFWPWEWTIEAFRDDLESALKQPHLLVPTGSVIREEFAHTAWSKINRSHSTIDDILNSWGARYVPELLSYNGLEIDGETLVALEERRDGWSHHGPWPEPDLAFATSGWVGSNFSEDRLRLRAEEVYNAAITAYLELSEGPFKDIGDFLSFRAGLPGTLVGHLRPAGEWSPGIDQYFLPDADRSAGVTSNRALMDIATSEQRFPTDAELQKMDAAYTTRRSRCPESRMMLTSSYSAGILDIFGTRPATNIAVGWLWEDLRSLGRIDSHFQELK